MKFLGPRKHVQLSSRIEDNSKFSSVQQPRGERRWTRHTSRRSPRVSMTVEIGQHVFSSMQRSRAALCSATRTSRRYMLGPRGLSKTDGRIGVRNREQGDESQSQVELRKIFLRAIVQFCDTDVTAVVPQVQPDKKNTAAEPLDTVLSVVSGERTSPVRSKPRSQTQCRMLQRHKESR